MVRSGWRQIPTIESLEGRALLSGDPLSVIVGAGAAKSVQFTDATGTQAQILLKGAGTANITFDGTGLSQSANNKGLVVNGSDISVSSIGINATNAQSVLQVITVKKRGLGVGMIVAGGALNAIMAPTVTVAGDISVPSGLHVLQLAGAHDGTIAIGSGRVGTLGVQVGTVTDESLNSDIPITTLVASQWVNTVGEGLSITAPTIKSIAISHDLTADLTAGTVGAISIKGTLSNSNLNLTTPLTPLGMSISTLTVGGAIASTDIIGGGTIGSINAGRMSDSVVYAGLVASPSGVFPSVATDFRNTATNKSVT